MGDVKMLVGRYQFIEDIGKGGFGVVSKYRDLIYNVDVAIKSIPSRVVNTETKRLFYEVDIMGFLFNSHPCVITYDCMFSTPDVPPPTEPLDAFTSTFTTSSNTLQQRQYHQLLQMLDIRNESYQDLSVHEKHAAHLQALLDLTRTVSATNNFQVHIVMPYNPGDILKLIKMLTANSYMEQLGLTDEYTATVSVVIAFKMLLGIDYLHKCGILHRDIKPENVLVELDRERAMDSNAVVCDLGLARDEEFSETAYVCTRYYRPPELITQIQKPDEKADVWSFGCVLFEMCTGTTLFTMDSSVNKSGQWDGGMASKQLEVVLNIVGTPKHEDIYEFVPDGNPKSYLLHCQPRPCLLEERFNEHWKLRGATHREKLLWLNLIRRCLGFFPQLRPTAREISQHELFQLHGLQYPSGIPFRRYVSSCSSWQGRRPRSEWKGELLEVLKKNLLRCSEAATDDYYDGAEEDEVGRRGGHPAMWSDTEPANASTVRGDGMSMLRVAQQKALAALPPLLEVAQRGEAGGWRCNSGPGGGRSSDLVPDTRRRRVDGGVPLAVPPPEHHTLYAPRDAPDETTTGTAGPILPTQLPCEMEKEKGVGWWVRGDASERELTTFSEPNRTAHAARSLSGLPAWERTSGTDDLAEMTLDDDFTVEEDGGSEWETQSPERPLQNDGGSNGLPPSVWQGMGMIAEDEQEDEEYDMLEESSGPQIGNLEEEEELDYAAHEAPLEHCPPRSSLQQNEEAEAHYSYPLPLHSSASVSLPHSARPYVGLYCQAPNDSEKEKADPNDLRVVVQEDDESAEHSSVLQVENDIYSNVYFDGQKQEVSGPQRIPSDGSFPPLHDPEIRERYCNYHSYFESSAGAMDQVLIDLNTYSSNQTKSKDLRELLRYFAAQPS